jgi:uncharacterized membrane protein
MNEITAIFLTAASPISEIRLAIPLGISFGLNPILVFFIAFLGNIFPVLILLLFFEKIKNFLKQRSAFFKKFFEKLDENTTSKFQKLFNKYKKAALLIFVAIPLPLSGAWSGVVAATLFNIPKKEAFWLISGGVFIAGIIILILSKLGFLIFLS